MNLKYKIYVKRNVKIFFFYVSSYKKEIFIKNEIEKILFIIKYNPSFLENKYFVFFLKKKHFLILKLINLIIKNYSNNLFINIIFNYIKDFKSKFKILIFFIISKYKINRLIYKTKKKVYLYKKKTIIINNYINTNIIGGFIMKKNLNYYNFTINNFLKKLKNNF
ncbi:ATP synthase F1, delta subunit [Candidatus Karelsulcia muelleri CARI]|uniref:ATP synthase F1, delta subunit n=1 Tax=Karelsulcia muelleri (strain CARI) TaxID=706194 RepID=E0TJ96_KARMC|nr:ATP synthase F1, delta subunit [Candidatus Karelsulcia muelleri CARI]